MGITRKGVVQLEAEDEEALQDRIADEGYFEDVLECVDVTALIEDVECLDDDDAE
jgi:hypothetical protein